MGKILSTHYAGNYSDDSDLDIQYNDILKGGNLNEG